MARHRVLVVDDHAIFRRGLVELLDEVSNVEVVAEAENGVEAVELTIRHAPDVVVMDLRMKHGDGMTAIRRIGELGLGTRTVVLSEYDDDARLAGGSWSGATTRGRSCLTRTRCGGPSRRSGRATAHSCTHLSVWTRHTDGFRVVLTSAFSDAELRDELRRRLGAADPGERTPEAVAGHVRRWLADQLAGCLDPAPEVDLVPVVFPVDLGDSWQRLRTVEPELGALAGPANELLVQQLADSVEVDAGEDGYHLTAPAVAVRLAARIEARRAARTIELGRLRQEHETAREQEDAARQAVRATRRRYDEAVTFHRALQTAVDRAATGDVPFQRPERPPMNGAAVREGQEHERVAWYAAARELWSSWRETVGRVLTPCPLPERLPIGEAELRAQYDDIVDCCERCSERWLARAFGAQPPDHCYQLMTGGIDRMREWIKTRLVAEAAKSVAVADAALVAARTRGVTTERLLAAAVTATGASRRALRDAERATTRQRRQEERDLAGARAIPTMLSRENRAHVRRLLARLHAAAPAERGWFAVAILRALYDLGRVTRT